jgi:hypothetical protein
MGHEPKRFGLDVLEGSHQLNPQHVCRAQRKSLLVQRRVAAV